jgi:opacity protein-like surface antigen
MRKAISAIALAFFGAARAEASGLYLSAGYSRPSLGFNVSQPIPGSDTICGDGSSQLYGCWSYDFSDEDPPATWIPNWPDGTMADGNPSNTVEWLDGTIAERNFSPSGSTSYMYAVGYDFGGTPWRIELEQSKTTFSSDGYSLTVPQSCAAGNTDNCNGSGGNLTAPPSDYYTYSLNGYQGGNLPATVTSLMVNTYFTLPFLGNFDPYIGVGIGKTKIDTSTGGVGGGSGNENAVQLMLGCEYWVPNTGWIVGLEYRQSKISGVPERDDTDTYLTFDNKSIVFKLRYDFISDEF